MTHNLTNKQTETTFLPGNKRERQRATSDRQTVKQTDRQTVEQTDNTTVPTDIYIQHLTDEHKGLLSRKNLNCQ